MRKRGIAALAACVLLAGCDTETRYGECVGVTEDKDPALEYRLDKSNVFVGVILSETVIVPVVVAADQLWCPVGRKAR